jgi:hypothetical protein
MMVKRPHKKENTNIESGDKSRFHSDVRHVKLLKLVMREAVTDALNVSKALNIPDTFMDHGRIIRAHPDGTQEVIAIQTKQESIHPENKLKKGAVINVRQQ